MTARFVTCEVHVVASVDVLGADGTVETITGTTIHPLWSVDRQEWVPLAKLADGERLCCDTESFGLGFPSSLTPKASGLVLSVSLSRVSQPVYNIEVHGEHVYQVGELGVVVHNSYYDDIVNEARKLYPGKAFKTELHHVTPKYLGGAVNGPMTRIDAAYHQLITNEFRSLWPYGGPKPSAEELARIMAEVYGKLPLP